jgi:hypothetical protein
MEHLAEHLILGMMTEALEIEKVLVIGSMGFFRLCLWLPKETEGNLKRSFRCTRS